MTGTSKSVFKSKDALSRQELADLFETLAKRIRSGTMTLSSGGGGNHVDLQLPETLTVEVEVEDSMKRSGIQREFELEMKWDVQDDGTPVAQQPPNRGFTIS